MNGIAGEHIVQNPVVQQLTIEQATRLEQEAALVGAALRYCAIADWFETRPISREEKQREPQAWDIFNSIEAELRQAGKRILRQNGHRQMVLQHTLEEGGIS